MTTPSTLISNYARNQRWFWFFALALTAFMFLDAPTMAFAEEVKWFANSGLTGAEDKVNKGLTIFFLAVKVILIAWAVWSFVKFLKDREWINLVFVAIGAAGAAYAPKLIQALFTWGET